MVKNGPTEGFYLVSVFASDFTKIFLSCMGDTKRERRPRVEKKEQQKKFSHWVIEFLSCVRERGTIDRGRRSRTDEDGRGMKEMEVEGARRCDGRNFFPTSRVQEIFCPKKVVRERRRGKNRRY